MRSRILLGVAALVAAFALGRYTGQRPAVEIKETAVTKQVQDVETKKTTTIVKSATGEVKTVITEDTVSKTKTDKSVVTKTKDAATLNVSLLVGYNYRSPSLPIYGVMVSKKLLGPIAVGAWGMTNNTAGISLGMEF